MDCGKKERRIVFAVGLAQLLLFTFTDLQISMAAAQKPLWAWVFEVVGEIPFTTLTIAACAILFRFRTKKNIVLNVLCAVGAGALFALFSLMGGFMTYNYLTDNLGQISMLWMVLIALVMAGLGIFAWMIPALAGKEKTLHTIVYVWCAVVGISRVFMGAHFRLDGMDRQIYAFVPV